MMKILSITQIGSKLFVNNPHDKDFLIIVSNDFSTEMVRNLRFSLPHRTDLFIKKEEQPYDNSYQELFFRYITQLIKENRLTPKYGTFSYESDDKKLLEAALNHPSFSYNTTHINGGTSKSFYYVLLTLFYFRKGNCSLTKEEKEQIQLAHDGYFPKEKMPAIKEELIQIYNEKFKER